MLPQDSTDTGHLYKNVLLQLRDRYQRHYNLYMRSQLLRKQQCYLKPGATVPVTPEEYYPCIDAIERELVAASSKLLSAVNELDDQDRSCKDTCRSTHEIEDKYKACLTRCVEKFEKAVDVVYTAHYDSVLSGDPEYRKLRK